MRIIKYKTVLDENLHNILVKEKSCNYEINFLNSPEVIVGLLNDIYKLNKQSEEYLYMLTLNTKSKLLGIFELSHGTVNQSLCSPREIFIKALLCAATNIVLVHNHPSGDCTPSQDDILVAKRVSEAGKIVGIGLLDNIVVANGYFSFAEQKIKF